MTRSVFAALIILAALFATFSGTVAQDSSPVAEMAPADDCDIEPRTSEDLANLNATATSDSATPVAMNPIALPDGDPVDATTLNALDALLIQVENCAEAGDLARLLALYSDAYVTGIALAPELVPIVPGHGHAHPGGPVSTPVPETDVAPHVETAVLLPDGRIAATVGSGGTKDIVFFVQERGNWVIDEIHESLPEGPIGGDLPFPVQAAVASAAAEFDVAIEKIVVESWEAIEWSDSSLGCPKPGEFYAQVITPGYRATLIVGGTQHEYHTDEFDRAVRCDPA